MALLAQTPANVTATQPSSLQAIQVTAEELPPEADRKDTPAPEVSVHREEFTRLPSDRASDIVGRMPGVVVSGPPGEKKAFSLRGLPSDFNRVELDGMRLPTSSQSRSYELMNMPGFEVESITIHRTPTAKQEADGIAGTIAVETRPIPEEFTAEGQIAIGGRDAINAQNRNGAVYMGSKASETLGFAAAVSYDDREIVKIKDKSERTYSGGPGGAGFLRDEYEPKQFQNFDAYALVEMEYDGGTLRFRPSVFDETTTLDKWRDQYRRLNEQFNDRTLTAATENTTTANLGVEHEHEFTGGTRIESRLMLSSGGFDSESSETTLNATLTNTGGSKEESEIKDYLVQWNSDLSVPVKSDGLDHMLGFGMAARSAWRDSDREVFTVSAAGGVSQTAANLTSSQESDYDIQESYLAAYAMDTLALGAFTLAPGLRLEHARDDMQGGIRSGKAEFTDLLPSVVASWDLDPVWRMEAGIARTVNRPKMEEIAPGITRRGQRSFNGNPDLKPAKAWGYDLGLSYTTSPLFLSVNLFHREVENVIDSVETSTNVYEFRNSGDGWTRGIELEQRLDIGRMLGVEVLAPFSIAANQTFLDSRVNDPMTGARPFTEQPDFLGNLSLIWDDARRGTRIAFSANYTADRPTISYEGTGQIRDKTRYAETILDLRIEQEVAPGLSIFGSAENLTDEDRDEIEYLNGTLNRTAAISSGRTFFIGANMKF